MMVAWTRAGAVGMDERGEVLVILKTSLPEFGDQLDVGI